MRTDLTKAQQSDLKRIIKAHFNKFKINELEFDDSCGCYSEYTTEPCKLEIEIEVSLPKEDDKQFEKRNQLENDIAKWASKTLEYTGCDCCEDNLWIYLRLVPKDKTHE